MGTQEQPRNVLCFQETEGSHRDFTSNLRFSPTQRPGSPLQRTQGVHPYLDGAVFKHIHSHFFLFLLLFLSRGLHHHSWELLDPAELQEDGGPAGVALDFHPQDAVAGPLIPHVLQAVDGRAGEGDVDVGQDEEHEESLKGRRQGRGCQTP